MKDGIAYIAKVQFKSDAPVSKEFMEEWTKSMEGLPKVCNQEHHEV